MTWHEDLGAPRRTGLIGLLVLTGLFAAPLLGGSAFPPSAGAAECITCEEEEEPPIEEEVFETLIVKVEGAGSVSDGTETVCSSSGATQTCEAEYEFGEKVTLSASPASGMTFLGWEGSGCSGAGTCSVTMTSAKSVTARFADKTPPAPPAITSPTSGQVFEWTAEEAVSVSFTDTDPTIVGFGCSVDFYSWNPCSSPWSTGKLAAGTHTVYVSAKDAAGNVSSTARSFKVVITPPEGGSGGEEPPKEEGGSGSGGSGGTPSPIPAIAPPPPAQINAQAVVKTHTSGKSTLFRKLTLKGLPPGAAVAATCKGKGCPFKRKTITVRNGVADLTTLFAKRRLGAGALIELKVTAPGVTGQTIDVKTRAGKAPKVTTS